MAQALYDALLLVRHNSFYSDSTVYFHLHPKAEEAVRAALALAEKKGGEMSTAGFNYIVSYGGGIGPDVWDKEMEISAVDIHDATKQAVGRMEECGGWVFMVSQEDYPSSTREQLEEKLHKLRMQVSELEQQIQSNPKALFVPTERARQMWPGEMPSCQIVDGGINVAARTVALASQEMMHKAYEEADILRKALEAITRNQNEEEGQEGICPFGCDAPWIAMSALGTWKEPGVDAWKPNPTI